MNAPPAAAVFDRSRTMAGAVERHAAERPDDTAFRFVARHAANTRELSWGDLDATARRVGAALVGKGLVGKPVAVICPDPRDFLITLCGCFYAGAVVVPVPAVATRRSAGRIGSILEAASPAAVLATAKVLEQPWIAELLEAGGIEGLPLTPEAGDRLEAIARPTDLDGPALIQFTSGSTGTPRGVGLSHANLASNCGAIVEAYGLSAATRGFSWLPLHHDMGLVGHVLTPLWIGCRSTIMDPLLFLQSPLRWLRRAGEEGATITSAPNFAYELCVKEAARGGDLAGIDLSSLTAMVCGGEAVWPETVDAFCRVFATVGLDRGAFAPSYGLAEATLLVSSGRRPSGPRVHADPVEGWDGAEAGGPVVSLGRPVSGVAVTIVDAGGNVCGDGVIGEIEISGESVGRPVGVGAKVGGRVPTGDLGFIHDGEVYISGRRKEIIILRGQNVYPGDIENAALRADPAIRPGAVAAVAVRDGGTEAMILVFEADRGLGADDFTAMSRRLNQGIAQATGHTPDGLVAVPVGALPRTTSGKIRRHLVSDVYGKANSPILQETRRSSARDEAGKP